MGRSVKAEDGEILRAIALSPDPIVTATELVDVLPYKTPDGVRNRLIELRDNGYLESREVGSRAEVWWLTEAGRENLRQ